MVPELASRDHIRRVTPLTRQVLEEAGIGMADVGAVAYTAGGSGRGAAGGRQRGAGAGLVAPPAGHRHPPSGRPSAVAHAGRPRPEFPFVALLVSGGHTQLMRVDGVGRYELLGETLDDAAGEAFDKSAKLMGLGYPGGPALSKLAGSGDATRFELPRPMLHSGDLDFSFSGLKTAVLTRVKAAEQAGGLDEQTRADLAAATQAAIVEVLAAKSIRALKQTGLRRLVVAGAWAPISCCAPSWTRRSSR